jgi:hypothetical protein
LEIAGAALPQQRARPASSYKNTKMHFSFFGAGERVASERERARCDA